MRMILGGGGGTQDSFPLDELYAAWIGPRRRLLYWPIAMRGEQTFESCFEWVTSTLSPFGITDITMWTELAGHREEELDGFDGVYIGGGNTFSLLAEVRESGYDRYLKAYIGRGKPVYGGSAGAVLLGRDIRLVENFDPNRVGITNTTGLDLAGGHAIFPHYEPRHDEWIRAYIRRSKLPVLAIPERSGVVIERDEMRSAGFEPALRFDDHGTPEWIR